MCRSFKRAPIFSATRSYTNSGRSAEGLELLAQIIKLSAFPLNSGWVGRTSFGSPDAPVAIGLQAPAGSARFGIYQLQIDVSGYGTSALFHVLVSGNMAQHGQPTALAFTDVRQQFPPNSF